MPTASKNYADSDVVSGDLMWPSNITSGFDYLRIDIVKFVPNRKGVSTASLYTSGTSSSIPAPTTNLLANAVLATAVPGLAVGGAIGQAGITPTTTTESSLGTIMLPVPEDLNYTDTPKWSDQEIGVLGKFGPALASAVSGGDSGAITTAIQELAERGKVDVALKALGKFADPNAITQNLNGKIANPYVEQIFGGLGLRSFDFSWKLVPRNKREQDSIHKIIRTLRVNALPNLNQKFGEFGNTSLQTELESEEKFGETNASDRWLTVPNIYKLRWLSEGAEIKSLPKIKPCVLKNIQVSYTPDNVWATHLKDGRSNPYPVAYNLNLSFGEVEIITGSDVSKGY